MTRKAKTNRKTKETNIIVEANIDGKGSYKIDTKIGFLNHMLEHLSIHSLIDLKISKLQLLIKKLKFVQIYHSHVLQFYKKKYLQILKLTN